VISRQPQRNERKNRRLALLLLAGVFSLGVLPHISALPGEFLSFDDTYQIVDNPYIRSLSPGSVLRMFIRSHHGEFLPAKQLSFALDYAVYGDRSWGYRLTNLLLHGANAVLVCLLAFRLAPFFGFRRSGMRELFALVVGAIFALHPVHVEAVVWLSSRKDALVAFWSLLSLHAFAAACRPTEGWRARTAVAAACVCALLAMLSKSSGLVVPLLMLFTGSLSYRSRTRTRFIGMIGFGVVCAFVVFVLGMFSAAGGGLRMGYPGGSFLFYLLSSCEGLYVYARNVVAPSWLHIPYRLNNVYYPQSVLEGRVVAGIVIAAAMLALLVWTAKRGWRAIWFGCLFAAIAMLPYCNIIPMRVPAFVADRYLYLAMVGLAIAGGSLLTALLYALARSSASAALIVAVAVLGAYGAESAILTRRWTCDAAFYSANLAINPAAGALWVNESRRVALEAGDARVGMEPLLFAIDAERDNFLAYVNLAEALFMVQRDQRLSSEFHAACDNALRTCGDSYLAVRARPRAMMLAAYSQAERDAPRRALELMNDALNDPWAGRDKKVTWLLDQVLRYLIARRAISPSDVQALGRDSPLVKALVQRRTRAGAVAQPAKRMTFEQCVGEGDRLMGAGSTDAAYAYYNAARKLKPDDVDINLKCAEALELMGFARLGARQLMRFGKGLHKSPAGRARLRELYYQVGKSYYRCGDLDEAEVMLQYACNFPAPEGKTQLNEDVALLLAEVMMAGGRREAAIRYLTRFANENGQSPRLRRKLEGLRSRGADISP